MPKPEQLKTLFAAITKVDVAKRTVTGIAMQEVVDRSNEKCLYDESKPYFLEWSATQEKASGGKSKGNVREMHIPSAVGTVQELICDDALKAFTITAEIVDEAAWEKVEKGVYTGFSIGANFARDANGKAITNKVDGVLEWVAVPVEVSLVDIPCVPTALFDLTKADGTTEKRKFASVETAKSMYSVSDMSYALSQIGYLVQDLEWEADVENDGSQIPARLREWLQSGTEIFLDLATEETNEFAARLTAFKGVKADRQKAMSGGCGCDCGACGSCGKKAANPTPKETQDDMTPEQTKALTDATEQMKAAAETIKALKDVPETLKAQGETISKFETRLKSLEESLAGLEEMEKALANEPAAIKTTNPAAVAVPREPEAAKGSSAEILKGDLTNDKASRLKGFAAIYGEGPRAGSGFVS